MTTESEQDTSAVSDTPEEVRLDEEQVKQANFAEFKAAVRAAVAEVRGGPPPDQRQRAVLESVGVEFLDASRSRLEYEPLLLWGFLRYGVLNSDEQTNGRR